MSTASYASLVMRSAIAGAALLLMHTMCQTPQHQQDLHCHKSLTTTPGGNGDCERVEQPASHT